MTSQVHPRGGEVLSEIERALKPASKYNSSLFSLYLIYLRRYQICYYHIRQARRLAALLEEKPWPIFTSWQQVIECSRRLRFNPKPRSCHGCPILKIGYILQELGVIGPKADEQGHLIQALLGQFDPKTRNAIEAFTRSLEQRRRATGTIRLYLHSLNSLNQWMKLNHAGSPLMATTPKMIDSHLSDFFLTHPKPRYRYNHIIHLKRFYHWAESAKLLLQTPCSHIQASRPAPLITICSEAQIHQLRQFLEKPHSDPTYALLLCLALFLGCTQADLLFATLDADSVPLRIVLERKPKTFHRRTYNREQVIVLPREPQWFLLLQLRFLDQWKKLHAETVQSFPRRSLILPRHGYYNRPVSRECIRKHMRQATLAATGTAIPLSVLRKTCGHLLSQNGDASTLSRLGWSRKHSFDYTWMPRQYFATANPRQAADG